MHELLGGALRGPFELDALEEEKTIGIVFNNESRPPSSYYKRYYGAPPGPRAARNRITAGRGWRFWR